MATTKQATTTETASKQAKPWSKRATKASKPAPTRKQASTSKALASKRTKLSKQATVPALDVQAYTYTVARIPRVRTLPYTVVRPDGSKLPERFQTEREASNKALACTRERKQALKRGWQASEQPKRAEATKQAPTGKRASVRGHDVHADARTTRNALWALVTDALRKGDADMPTYTLTLWASASARGHEHETASKRKIRTITGVRASDVAWAYKRVHAAMRETGLASEYSEMSLMPTSEASKHGKRASGHGHGQACADTLAYAHEALASKRA